MISARQLVEALYGAQGVLRLPWIKIELPALVSANTRGREKPYRITWFTAVERRQTQQATQSRQVALARWGT